MDAPTEVKRPVPVQPWSIEDEAAAIVEAVTAATTVAESTRIEAPRIEAARIESVDTRPREVRAPTLTERQRAILDFERLWWRKPGAKEQAIRDSFDVSPTRYYQALNALLDLPDALDYDATLVNRLLRQRASALRRRGVR